MEKAGEGILHAVYCARIKNHAAYASCCYMCQPNLKVLEAKFQANTELGSR